MSPRTIFASINAQPDNLGDIEIRQTLLGWLLDTSAPITLFAGTMPAGYLAAFDLPDRVRVLRSPVEFQLALLRRVASRRASIVFAPGPQVFGLHPAGLLKSLLNLVNVSLVRASGGQAIAVGRSLRGTGRLPRSLERMLVSRFSVFAVRDDRSAIAVGLPLEVCPDLAFAHTGAVTVPKSTAVISLRSDRAVNLTLLGAAIEACTAAGLTVRFVTQVQRDDAQHERLAAQFGVEAVLWGDKSHTEQFAAVHDAHARARIVLSNRLHALILGVQHEALPVALVEPSNDKLMSTLRPWINVTQMSTARDDVGTLEDLLQMPADLARERLRYEAGRTRSALEALEGRLRAALSPPRPQRQRQTSSAAANRSTHSAPVDALYLAVLPFYRQECARVLVDTPDQTVRLLAGDRHVDPTIRTGIDRSLYTPVRNIVLGNRVLLQLGGWHTALTARSAVLDLNPRSVTAWSLLLARRALGRRTLVWGHLHPRAGAASRTAVLRRSMRRLASGTVLYGYDGVPPARTELPGGPLWVAPNSLYRAADMQVGLPAVHTPDALAEPYSIVLYVGRLVAEKKVDLLIRGYRASSLHKRRVQLVIVGEGSERENLEFLAAELDIALHVTFLGQIAGVDELRAHYAHALCSVSPGYVGLSLTQSLGFGVPMLVSRDEPHSPEIELARLGGVTYFDTDSASALAAALDTALAATCHSFPTTAGVGELRAEPQTEPVDDSSARVALAAAVRDSYSAEAMAAGILAALNNTPQQLGDDGWPPHHDTPTRQQEQALP